MHSFYNEKTLMRLILSACEYDFKHLKSINATIYKFTAKPQL